MAQTVPDAPGIICGSPTGTASAAGSLTDVDDGPEVRALIVFVKFLDDQQAGVGGWPLYADPRTLPPDALNILAPTLADIPSRPFTLSKYFSDQSRTSDGVSHLQVYGGVLPTNTSGQPITYVTQHTNDWYYNILGTANRRGYGYLTQEILDHLTTRPGFDIADYDQNEDDVLDHLFLVIRTDKKKNGPGQSGPIFYAGCSTLNGCVSDIIGDPGPLSYFSPQRGTRVGIDWFESGSHNYMWDPANVVHLPYLITLLAHEWGHELWNEEAGSNVHRVPVRDNRVPMNAVTPTTYFPQNGRNEYGYALMSGGCAGRIGGSLTVAARERDLLGWLSPTVLGPGQSGQTFSLGDLYTTGQAFKLSVANTPGRLVYLSNHQRIGWFDEQRSQPTEPPPFNQFLVGLHTRGMLASYSTALGTLDILPPDNLLQGADICTGGVLANNGCVPAPNPFETDGYGPTTGRQLTPWTSPNINGCSGYGAADPHCSGAGFTPSWQAIDDIRYDADGVTMQFEFYQDIRTQPLIAIRSNSRMGTETSNRTFTDVVVKTGATLTVGDGIALSFTGDLVVEAGATLTLAPGTTLRFADGRRLLVYGTLIGTGATLAAIGGGTWGGFYVGPNPLVKSETSPAASLAGLPLAATFTGVTVTGVFQQMLSDDPYPPSGAIEVRNRRVLLNGGTSVRGSIGANGVYAYGSAAQVVIQGNSQIIENQGAGISAAVGAQVYVTEGARIELNEVGGVYLNGYATRAFIDGGARVDGNTNAGVLAYNQSSTRIRSGLGTVTSVSNNHGGPTALTSGSVDGGQCNGYTDRRPNLFSNNQFGGFYDARAEDGSTVAARYAYWDGRTALTLVRDKSSTVDVFPVAPTATSQDPNCAMIDTQIGCGVARSAQDVASADDDSPEAARGGPTTAAVVALATEARQAAWAGDPDGAFALLTQAAAASLTEDDREAVYGAVGALIADADSARSVPSLVSSLEATAATASPNVPWAQRALAVAYAVTQRPADADGVAATLVMAQAGTDHATFAHGLRVRLAVEADSLEMALDRLSALGATVAPTDTFAVETYASSLSLVSASFPAADLSGLTGGVAGRSAGRSAGVAGSAATRQGRETFVDDVAVYPNPTAGRGTVRVSVSQVSSNASVTVYDALGRRVAVLHDGELTAGPHDLAFETAALAPGVYVVHVRVSPEAGGAWTEVRRVTVTR